MKTTIVLEEINNRAKDPESMDFETPTGYGVKEVEYEECDHPKTTTMAKEDEGIVVESCNVCGKESEQPLNTNLQRDNNDN